MKPVIHQIYANNSLRNFNYLIETSNQVLVIDPYDAAQVMAVIDSLGKKVMAIINTHEHHDHIRGNADIMKKYSAPVWAHHNAMTLIPNVKRALKVGDQIELDPSWTLEVLDTPGHTHAHLCLVLKSNNVAQAIFTGDTLFNAGVGNCHNGGDPEVLFETIRDYFMTLADEVIVYPGHDYMRTNLGFTLDREPSNSVAREWQERHQQMDHNSNFWQTKIGDEKKINTFLRLNQADVIKHLPVKAHNDKEVFLTLRQLRNNW